MDAEIKTEFENLKEASFALTAMQLLVAARVNALLELQELVLEHLELPLHPTDPARTVFLRLEAEHLDRALGSYSDNHPSLAGAMKKLIDHMKGGAS